MSSVNTSPKMMGENRIFLFFFKQKEAYELRLASEIHQREQAILEQKRAELRALREAIDPEIIVERAS